MSSNMPEKITVFRGVGSSTLHVGRAGETMSWGNSDGATYIKKDSLTKTIPLSMWQDIVKSLAYIAENPGAHTLNKTSVATDQLREISEWEKWND